MSRAVTGIGCGGVSARGSRHFYRPVTAESDDLPPTTSACTPAFRCAAAPFLPDTRVLPSDCCPNPALLTRGSVLTDPRQGVPRMAAIMDRVAPTGQGERPAFDASSTSRGEPGHDNHLPTRVIDTRGGGT